MTPGIPSSSNAISGRIDMAKLAQRLTEINLQQTSDRQVDSTDSHAAVSDSSPSCNGTPSTQKHDLKEWLDSHGECLVDTEAWPHWLEGLNQLRSEFNRPLVDFPVDDNDYQKRHRYRLIRLSHEGFDGNAVSAFERIKELRVAVIGNVDAGKSTLLSVLSRGGLDDGRGGARAHCAKHQHEVQTGRTSSVTQEILGYKIDGQALTQINSTHHAPHNKTLSFLHQCQKAQWEEHVGRASWKIISLIDLAGHERYLKTTMFGLTGFCPDIAILLVGANTGGLIGTTREHLALATALSLPVIVVVTKVDLAPDAVKTATMSQIHRALKAPSCRRNPFTIHCMDDIYHVIRSRSFASNQIAPIIEISNVTGQGIALLRALLNHSPLPDQSRERFESAIQISRPVEYQINETYSVPGVGTVVSGILLSGTVQIGEQLMLGPIDSSGKFSPTVVKGIQRKRVPLGKAVSGQGVSFALKKIRKSDIRYGMVLVSPALLELSKEGNSHANTGTGSNPRSRSGSTSAANSSALLSLSQGMPLMRVCREFTAQVVILFHSTTITSKYQAMLHCGAIRQTVQIVSINIENNDGNIGRSGDRAKIHFRFMKHPEMLQVGMRIIFREGRTRGLGKIVELH